MLNALKDFYRLLTPEQRRKLLLLQILVVMMSVMEVVSVLSIGPFMAMVGDLGRIEREGLLADAYRWSGADSPTEFVVLAGAASLTALTLSALLSMYTLWRLHIYGALVGAELGNRLFAHYMAQPWLFHASGNSSILVNKISNEVQRVTYGVINAFMHLNAKLMMAVVMVAAVVAINPLVALIGVSIFATAYIGLYKLVRMRLVRNGKKITQFQAQRLKLMGEGFGGIKDTLLLGRQQSFTDRFTRASRIYSLAVGNSQVAAQVPRYAIELLALGSVIAVVMYLVVAHPGQPSSILPVLSVYALAGIKLLPAFQQLYSSATHIRGSLPALENIREDLRSSMAAGGARAAAAPAGAQSRLEPYREVRLRQVFFRYPGAERHALAGLDLAIPAHKVIGIVGASGSGKSTAVDVLLGLVQPGSGELLVDGEPIVPERNLRAWQNAIGFVAQSIFLADASIRENIAFGLDPAHVDEARVARVVQTARLAELVATLPDGLDTRVGERGVQLSGGQRQRIGIARALYNDASVLVLDEATSALDGITEKLVMEAIQDLGGSKTVVLIAHRLATVRKCDWIYVLDEGKVVDQGTYDHLMSHNVTFRRMAAHI